MRPSPLDNVKKSFGDRAKLVDQLASMVDKTHGDTTDQQVRSRLMGLSNQKLLRLYSVEQAVRERFGDREKLIQHIVDSRKKAGLSTDAAFQAKLASSTKARLLDLTRASLSPRPAKQSAEQKLKSKRGRKERERALSKLGKA